MRISAWRHWQAARAFRVNCSNPAMRHIRQSLHDHEGAPNGWPGMNHAGYRMRQHIEQLVGVRHGRGANTAQTG